MRPILPSTAKPSRSLGSSRRCARHAARDELAGDALVVGRAVAHAAEAAAAGGDLGLQHVAHLAPSIRSAQPMIASQARVLPYWPEALCAAMPFTNSTSPTGFISSGPAGAEHRLAFEEHRRDDVVAAAECRPAARAGSSGRARRRVPEMMVRIDDRQLGLERRLRWPLGEPGGEIGIVAMEQSAIFTCRPCCFLLCLACEPTKRNSGERGHADLRIWGGRRSAAISRRAWPMPATRSRSWRAARISRRSAPAASPCWPATRRSCAKVKASDRPADLGPQDAVLVTMKASGQHALADSDRAAARARHAGGVRAERHSLVVRPRARQVAAAGARPVAARSGRRARQGGRPGSHRGRGASRSPNHVVEPGVIDNELARPQHALGRRDRRPARRRASRRCARR